HGSYERQTMAIHFREAPFILRHQLVDDIPGSQGGRQDLPSVGLEFEVTTPAGRLGEISQQPAEVIPRVAKSNLRTGVERYMEVNAPLLSGMLRSASIPGQGFGKIQEAPLYLAPCGDEHLMKVDAFLKGLETLHPLWRRPELQRGAAVNLADTDPCLVEPLHGLPRFFKLDGQVAGVIVHTDRAPQALPLRSLAPFQEAGKEVHCLLTVFKEPQGFGLEIEVDIPTTALTDPIHMLGTGAQVPVDG